MELKKLLTLPSVHQCMTSERAAVPAE